MNSALHDTVRCVARRTYAALGNLLVTIMPKEVRDGRNPWARKPEGGAALEVPYPLAKVLVDGRDHLAKLDTPTATSVSRDSYLDMAESIVAYFRQHQQADGRILDPYVGREVQYSTPCYAWVSALLAGARGGKADFLESASAALTASLHELITGTPADRHGDFFTIFVMLAFDQLKTRVSVEQRESWAHALKTMHASCIYKDVFTLRNWSVNNWNMVALSGEYARSAAGFGNDAFVKRYLKSQLAYFTSEGLYRDPYVPMAYDLWARYFASLMLRLGYAGEYRNQLEELLDRGAYTSLLMMSPCGELPVGGRSA